MGCSETHHLGQRGGAVGAGRKTCIRCSPHSLLFYMADDFPHSRPKFQPPVKPKRSVRRKSPFSTKPFSDCVSHTQQRLDLSAGHFRLSNSLPPSQSITVLPIEGVEIKVRFPDHGCCPFCLCQFAVWSIRNDCYVCWRCSKHLTGFFAEFFRASHSEPLQNAHILPS